MFLEIEKSLMDLRNRYVGVTLNIQGSNMEFSDIVEMLNQEKSQFEVRYYMVIHVFFSCLYLLRLHQLLIFVLLLKAVGFILSIRSFIL